MKDHPEFIVQVTKYQVERFLMMFMLGAFIFFGSMGFIAGEVFMKYRSGQVACEVSK